MNKRTGIVLSIERCAMHDGPGIRTAVFLKGCPLRCAWCHNPQSQSPDPQLQYRAGRCTNCGKCAAVCPHGAHVMDPSDSRHLLDRSRCTLCGKCTSVCASNALKIAGTRMHVDEVVAEVQKDREYYAESGGGLTVSGGEPLFQFDFSLALLRECKKRGINTCIETCGFTTIDRFLAIAPHTDLFLFDYKATGNLLHRELTGVDQAPILSALNFLDQAGKPIILRCPLVPGINDAPEHLRAIAELSKSHPNITAVQIMGYHDYARDSYGQFAMECPLPAVASVDETVKEEWVRKIKEYGCLNVEVG